MNWRRGRWAAGGRRARDAGRALGQAVGGWTRRHWKGLGLALLVPVVVLVVLDLALDEPLRRRMERNLNARLQGYSVQLGGLDFHVLGGSVDLHDLVVRQDANPDPPVARIGRLGASVHWRVLLTSGRVVADFSLDRPALYVNRAQLLAEDADEVPVDERGWQDAVREIYPFEINQLRVRDGELVYVDRADAAPLRLHAVGLVARNIRNIESRERTYPSELRVEAVVFDRGRLRIDGHADFLAVPHPGVQADVTVEDIGLDYFEPVAGRYNVQIGAGSLSARGAVEYAPSIQTLHLRELRVDGLEADYVHSAPTAGAERETRRKVAETAEEVTNEPGVRVRVDRAIVHARTLGFVNEAADPDYRVFLDQATVELRNLSSRFEDGPATAVVSGQFMGSGRTSVRATFRPEAEGPDFDLAVRIDDTQMRAMNHLLRAYGNFDVVSGLFSFYGELAVKAGRIEGYVKPLFRDMDVYDARQEREKGLFRKLYEGLVGGIARLLENRPREEVATKASITGPVKDPRASTWEVVVRLVQNAFFDSILPGFDQELRRGRG